MAPLCYMPAAGFVNATEAEDSESDDSPVLYDCEFL